MQSGPYIFRARSLNHVILGVITNGDECRLANMLKIHPLRSNEALSACIKMPQDPSYVGEREDFLGTYLEYLPRIRGAPRRFITKQETIILEECCSLTSAYQLGIFSDYGKIDLDRQMDETVRHNA